MTTGTEIKGNNGKNNRSRFYIILVILLVLVNGVLIIFNMKSKKEASEITAERNELDSLYQVVIKDLDEKRKEIMTLKGLNDELDSLLTEKEKELLRKKEEIEQLLQSQNITKQELAKAQKLIKQLELESKKYLATIDSLEDANRFLMENLERLNEELGEEIERSEKLEKEKEILEQKVKVGALLEPVEFTVTGIKVRSNNKESATRSAKKTDKLLVCFTVDENKMADPGKKTIFIRLVTPEGSTLAIQSMGSGVLTLNDGEQIQYSIKADFEYDNARKKVCAYWSQNYPFVEGEYKAFLYQDGYQIAETSFRLK